MNKDAILASVIGFAIGLFITGAIIVGPKMAGQIKIFSKGDVASASVTEQNKPTPTAPATDGQLTIESPVKQAIVTEKTLSVSGKSNPNSLVIIGSFDEEVVVESGDDGAYQGSVAIKEGKNEVTVTNLVDGKPTVERTTVFYSEN